MLIHKLSLLRFSHLYSKLYSMFPSQVKQVTPLKKLYLPRPQALKTIPVLSLFLSDTHVFVKYPQWHSNLKHLRQQGRQERSNQALQSFEKASQLVIAQQIKGSQTSCPLATLTPPRVPPTSPNCPQFRSPSLGSGFGGLPRRDLAQKPVGV